MNLDLRLSTSLPAVRTAGWDDLAGTFDLYASTSWLSVEERIASGPVTYVLGSQEGRLLAGLPCYVLGPETPPWPFARVDAFIARLLRERGRDVAPVAARLAKALPTVLCGGRRPGHARLLVSEGLDAAERRRRAGEVLEEAEAFARSSGAASVSFLYVDEDDRDLREALLERGYAEFPSAVASRLAVPPDFDTYLQGLGADRRNMVRRERKRLGVAGIEYRAQPLSEALLAEILPLELALCAKYGVEFSPADATRLHRAVAAELGERAQVLTAERDGKVRGFLVLIRWRDTLFGRQAGFDYEFQGDLPLYFGLIFYAAIEYAITVGARHIEYGLGSEQAKALRGCLQRRQYGYLKVFESEDHAALREVLAMTAVHFLAMPGK